MLVCIQLMLECSLVIAILHSYVTCLQIRFVISLRLKRNLIRTKLNDLNCAHVNSSRYKICKLAEEGLKYRTAVLRIARGRIYARALYARSVGLMLARVCVCRRERVGPCINAICLRAAETICYN